MLSRDPPIERLVFELRNGHPHLVDLICDKLRNIVEEVHLLRKSIFTRMSLTSACSFASMLCLVVNDYAYGHKVHIV